MKNMIGRLFVLGAGACAALLAGCGQSESTTNATGAGAANSSSIVKEPFGKAPDGQAVDVYTLKNAKGAEARIMTYGGVVLSLKMPDKSGQFGDVVLGCDKLTDYTETPPPYFGALIGRYGNRIGKAQFTLDGKTYQLAANDHGNTLHGGKKGFDKVVWTATDKKTDAGPSLVLNYVSKDGEEGYPGTLNVTATYTLTDKNELRIDFTATTDKDTVVNLTHHGYFNLAGKGDILGHILTIPADNITPVDAGLIPLGTLQPVDGTPFDFRKPTAIGARINADDAQLKLGPGYDHNWVINKKAGELSLMAHVSEPITGRVMEVWSTEPGLQFYTGNFLDGTIKGKGGTAYQKHSAFCMEPQHFPDSPNKPQFPSTELKPGETYKNTIIYRFSVQ
jgi:aldose 1-epimerase